MLKNKKLFVLIASHIFIKFWDHKHILPLPVILSDKLTNFLLPLCILIRKCWKTRNCLSWSPHRFSLNSETINIFYQYNILSKLTNFWLPLCILIYHIHLTFRSKLKILLNSETISIFYQLYYLQTDKLLISIMHSNNTIYIWRLGPN